MATPQKAWLQACAFGWLISRLHALGARSFFQVASVVTTVYNIKIPGFSGALYKYSTAVFSWVNFEPDGASLPTHTAFANNGLRSAVLNYACMCEWQATFIPASASNLASATGYCCARSLPSCSSSPSRYAKSLSCAAVTPSKGLLRQKLFRQRLLRRENCSS